MAITVNDPANNVDFVFGQRRKLNRRVGGQIDELVAAADPRWKIRSSQVGYPEVHPSVARIPSHIRIRASRFLRS